MDDNVYTSAQLYTFYKDWLIKSIASYRQCDIDGSPAKEQFLKLSHRASCLTDIWLRISKVNARRDYGPQM